MNEERITESPSWDHSRGQMMKTPDDVAEMLRLKACGWGLKRIGRAGLQPSHGEGLRGGGRGEAVQIA